MVRAAVVGLVVGVAVLLAIVLRRQALHRAVGTIEVSMRLADAAVGRGWVHGVGRFGAGGTLRWYRIFSLSMRPRRVLLRRELVVLGRREPSHSERRALHAGAVVLECLVAGQSVELALDAAAVTGFLAWLESRPPGATLPRT